MIAITDVAGDAFMIEVKEGSLPIYGGGITIWCSGIEHVWIGEQSYADHIFHSDSDDPLRFLLDSRGYVYVGGTGTVTLPDGTKATLP